MDRQKGEVTGVMQLQVKECGRLRKPPEARKGQGGVLPWSFQRSLNDL